MNDNEHGPNGGRRRLLAGVALGGAAVVGGVAGVTVARGGGWQRRAMTMDVACLGHTWRQSMADNPSAPDDFRMPFLVEGSIYPEGTVGDGFVPTNDGIIGRWFCQGWLLVHADRPEPHVSSRQVYVFGPITEDEQFPVDTMASVGLEGTSTDQTATRVLVGGTGRYLGATGQVLEVINGANTTVLDDGTGDLAPNFTFEFDYFVPEL